MDEHNELRTRLRAVGMELFRRDGLRFTMAPSRRAVLGSSSAIKIRNICVSSLVLL